MEYISQSDEQLVSLIKNGDENALDFLMQRFKPVALSITRSYFLIGGDQDDLMQEAMIGLYKACLSFSESQGASFLTFAKKCITRNVQTAVKAANRKKNMVLNSSLNLSPQGNVTYGDEDEDEDVSLVIASNIMSPDERLLEEEKIEEIKRDILSRLSTFETRVLKYYLKGQSYTEIASSLGETPKKIDNALSRIKSKLRDLNHQSG